MGSGERVNDVQRQPAVNGDITLSVDSALDLGQVRQHVRDFLSGVAEPTVADAVLAVVMLTGDACRRGDSPVTVRLQRLSDEARLRVEVADRSREPADPPAEDYRSVILDRITDKRGVELRDDGTTTWAEVALAVAS
jgi:hypothetical protein